MLMHSSHFTESTVTWLSHSVHLHEVESHVMEAWASHIEQCGSPSSISPPHIEHLIISIIEVVFALEQTDKSKAEIV